MKDTILEQRIQPRLWTRYYLLIMLVAFFVGMVNNLMIPTLPLYLRHLGSDNAQVGLVMGLFSIAALIARPIFGNLIDRVGRRPILYVGGIIFLVGIALQGAIGTPQWVMLCRFLQGLGFAGISNAMSTMVSDIVPHQRLTEGIGYYGISNTLATAVGPMFGLAILNIAGYPVLFGAASLAMVLSLVAAWWMNYERNPQQHKDTPVRIKHAHDAAPPKGIAGLLEVSALPTALITLFLAFSLGGVFTFLPGYAASSGMGNIGLFFTLYACAILFTRFVAPILIKRVSEGWIVHPSIVLMGVSMFLLAYGHTPMMLILAALAYGLGFGMVSPILNAVIIRHCAPSRRGAANATYFLAFDVGVGSSSIFWGLLAKGWGIPAVFLGCAGCALLAMMAYQWIQQPIIRKRELHADAKLHGAG